jgi:hypothetical protein
MACPREKQCKDIRDTALLHTPLFYCFLQKGMPRQTKSNTSGKEPGVIGRFVDQYEKKQTSRAYRTDLEKFEAFLDENRDPAQLEDASRGDVLQFLFEESQSVSRSTVRRRATALKSFFGWIEGEGQRDDRPIGEDENVSELVDSVLENGPPSEENRGSAEQDRQRPSEEPSAEKKQTSDGEPTSAKKPTEGEEPTEEEPTGREDLVTGHPLPGGAESTDPEEGAGLDKEKSPLGEQGRQDEQTGRQDETAPEDEEPPQGEEKSQSDTYSSEGPLDIPHWVYDASEEKADDPLLRAGTHIRLAEVPGAVRYGLCELSEWTDSEFGPDRIRITCEGGDLVVEIQFREDNSGAEGARVEAQIEHHLIDFVAEMGPESLRSQDAVPEQALWYFRGRGWSMPPVVYELVDFSHAGGQSDERPTWTSTSPDSTQARYQAAVEVTGALAKAFGLAKDERVLVSLGP